MTIRERLGRLEGVQVAYIGDGNNVCASLMVAAAKLGMHFVAAPSRPATSRTSRRSPSRGGRPRTPALRSPSCTTRGRPRAAPTVLYTDVWTSMGQEEERERRPAATSPASASTTSCSSSPRPTRSSSTACRRTTARRSPRRSSTAAVGGLGRGGEPPARPEGADGARLLARRRRTRLVPRLPLGQRADAPLPRRHRPG